MGNIYNVVEKRMPHFILDGTSYEIGKRIGTLLRNKYEGFVSFLTSGNLNPQRLGFNNFQEMQELYEECCPGISDEIQGFADSLNVQTNKIIFYGFPFSLQQNCSHMVALSSITNNNHVLVGRSYEWNHNEEDLILFTTKVREKNAHIGFSNLLLGRYEGFNANGLCITSSGGGAYNAPIKNKKGIFFSLAIRSVLENCVTVEAGIDLLQDLPVFSSSNFILAEKKGKAALIECLDSEYSIKEINCETSSYLISTNHYTLPEKIKYNKYVNNWLLLNSKTRYERIKSEFNSDMPSISQDTMKNILSNEIPNGVCAYYHKDCFGTLWSMIFDLTDETVEISFGPPSHNKWNVFDFKTLENSEGYLAQFPESFIE
jgi:predicted choloylglycine hydrolase